MTPPRAPGPPGEEPASEHDIALAAQRGSAEAFAELVRRHERRAYTVARAISATHEDAEDAVQEGFLHAYQALDRFRPDQPFAAWLGRIVANAALDIARRRKVRHTEALTEHHAHPFRDPAADDELRRRLVSALDTLTPPQRAVVVLHDVEGFSHAEIGGLLDMPEGTARAHLHHARVALRKTLSDLRGEP
jgi:RNA polymerase sigma-70 factor (ECF subfamily)